ncbi:acyl-CoA reductase [Pedosphaera parvula]|uniref:Acyl-CoA reductase n=1 Tax=Pedosphaera parvula (strain Ellin514) TaxID=320771 RepID=B9XN01_PEDPL|nr:acyl-CoA reductase [Pedosphaera parvula]EEF58797.1 acyl-CoA reductase [Pedosphaera parvula Ellin514]
MNLPNYFLADLPPEATFSHQMIEDACRTLKRNREQYLTNRNTASLVRLIASVCDNWLDPEYPFRKYALHHGPKETGFSAAILAAGLDGFFKQVTAESLNALMVQELGHARRLDEPCATNEELKAQRAAMVTGPELLVHITGGCLPNPVLTSIILGLLVRSAQFVKCASGTSFLPRLFAHSLYEADGKLGSCLEIAEWKGGNAHLEKALFHEADCVTATGNDETLAEIKKHVPSRTRFLGYGHRVSFGYVTHQVLSSFSFKKVVARAANDVVAWNQLGCLSPHVIYVETGGSMSPEGFAEMLAEELAKREQSEPRGDLPPESAATISSRRAFYEVRAAHSPETRHWCSENSTAWTVIYEAEPRFQLSCLNRFIYVKSITGLTEALQNADTVRGKVSTVGLAATEERMQEMVTQLANWGVTRVCPLGKMQEPPFLWRHDGRPALGDLVTWTDWEQT